MCRGQSDYLACSAFYVIDCRTGSGFYVDSDVVCRKRDYCLVLCCCVVLCEFLRIESGCCTGIGTGIYASSLIVMGRYLRLGQMRDIMAFATAMGRHCDLADDVEVWRGHKYGSVFGANQSYFYGYVIRLSLILL